MSDLISREKVLRGARPEYLNPQQEKLSSYNQGWNNALDEYFDRIKALPSADAVEVVRCGECKHMISSGGCSIFADSDIRPSASDFCSYGERE